MLHCQHLQSGENRRSSTALSYATIAACIGHSTSTFEIRLLMTAQTLLCYLSPLGLASRRHGCCWRVSLLAQRLLSNAAVPMRCSAMRSGRAVRLATVHARPHATTPPASKHDVCAEFVPCFFASSLAGMIVWARYSISCIGAARTRSTHRACAPSLQSHSTRVI